MPSLNVMLCSKFSEAGRPVAAAATTTAAAALSLSAPLFDSAAGAPFDSTAVAAAAVVAAAAGAELANFSVGTPVPSSTGTSVSVRRSTKPSCRNADQQDQTTQMAARVALRTHCKAAQYLASREGLERTESHATTVNTADAKAQTDLQRSSSRFSAAAHHRAQGQHSSTQAESRRQTAP
jgi:hypothetical protein